MSEEITKDFTINDVMQYLATRFDAVDARFNAVDARFNETDARLTKLETFAEDRSRDTRPMLDRIVKEVADTRVELREVRAELAEVRTDLGEVKVELAEVKTELSGAVARLVRVEEIVYGLDRKFRVFNKDLLRLQDEQDDLRELVVASEKVGGRSELDHN